MEDDLHAIRDIPAGEELTIDYRTVCEWSARRP
jgi:SET domain-containing protein